jgi:hypothetical protein
MKTYHYLAGFGIVVLLVFTAGCAFLEPPQANTTPLKGTGTIQVTSEPLSASIYLDGAYKGRTPMTLKEIPTGDHEIILSKDDYQDYNQAVFLNVSQTINIKANLVRLNPKLGITITESKRGFRGNSCFWGIYGEVFNVGGYQAKNAILIATMTNEDSDEDYETTKPIGYINPGETKEFYIEVVTDCGDEYSGEVEVEYVDSEDEEESVSVDI